MPCVFNQFNSLSSSSIPRLALLATDRRGIGQSYTVVVRRAICLSVCVSVTVNDHQPRHDEANEQHDDKLSTTLHYTYGRRAFSVAGPTAWNSLLSHLETRQSAMPASDGI